MAPKDEMSERNQAVQMAEAQLLDPINLFKALNDPDPINTAKMVTMFRVNPQLYMQTFFPEAQPMGGQMGAPMGLPQGAQPEQGGAPQPGSPPTTLAEPQATSDLSAVPIQPLAK